MKKFLKSFWLCIVSIAVISAFIWQLNVSDTRFAVIVSSFFIGLYTFAFFLSLISGISKYIVGLEDEEEDDYSYIRMWCIGQLSHPQLQGNADRIVEWSRILESYIKGESKEAKVDQVKTLEQILDKVSSMDMFEEIQRRCKDSPKITEILNDTYTKTFLTVYAKGE